MLPLCGQAVVLGDHRPAIRQQTHVGFAGIDHRFDRQRHAFAKLQAGAALAVVQNLRVFMKNLADAVAAVFADDRKAVFLDMFLHGGADIAQAFARAELLNT